MYIYPGKPTATPGTGDRRVVGVRGARLLHPHGRADGRGCRRRAAGAH